MRFRNRREAGRLLGARLASVVDAAPAILGIPRGGLIVAAAVREVLGGDLDVAVARKVGHPHNPELAMAAVGPEGGVIEGDPIAILAPWSEEEREAAVRRARAEVQRRLRTYRGNRPPIRLEGREVVVVDDGAATGLTLVAALQDLRSSGAARLVAAAPVASPEAAALVRRYADEAVFLWEPEAFRAVSCYYEDFDQVDDAAVVAALDTAARSSGGPANAS